MNKDDFDAQKIYDQAIAQLTQAINTDPAIIGISPNDSDNAKSNMKSALLLMVALKEVSTKVTGMYGAFIAAMFSILMKGPNATSEFMQQLTAYHDLKESGELDKIKEAAAQIIAMNERDPNRPLN